MSRPARPRPGRHQQERTPLGDEHLYGLAPSTIDVRVRTKNVLVEAVEMATSGQQAISLDNTVAVMRAMVARMSAHLR